MIKAMSFRPILTLFAIALFASTFASGAEAQSVASYDQVIERANRAMLTDPATALSAAEHAEQLAGRNPEHRARALWLQSEASLRIDRAQPAQALIERAWRLIRAKDAAVSLKGDILLTRGGIYAELAQVGKALEDYQQAYRLFVSTKDQRKQSIALSTLASLHRQGGDFETALRYFQQAAEAYPGDANLAVALANNRGNVLIELRRHDEAVAAFRRALAESAKLNSESWTARILANLARAQLLAGDVADARVAVARGRALIQGDPDSSRALGELQVIASLVALEQADVGTAQREIDAAFAGVDLATTTLQARASHRAAYMVYSRAGRTERALAHLEALRRLDEQATQIATSTRAALMSARFDFANQELRIANLKAEELRQTIAFERSQAQFQQTIFIVAALGTLLIFGLLAYNLIATRRSRNKIQAANAELEVTNLRLEKALAAKTEFLATTSHEIRTPLNGILGMTQVMLADGSVSGKLKDRIDIVHGAGLTMKALVDDILDVAKMETGHLSVSLEPTDLHATLGEVTRMWEEQAHAKGLAFMLDAKDAPRWVETDPGRLRQIAFNLLANALKFTESGGITMRVMQRGEGADARLLIAVRDTGIGIAADHQADIFESFKQVDSGTTRKYGGTGLGLAICRNLAQALGGDIAVESIEGEGATFTVNIPLRLASAPDGIEENVDGGVLLIFDRNPINRSMLKTLLEPRAGQVRFATSVEETVRAVQSGGVSHLLIDDASVRGGDADPIALIGKVTSAAASAGARSAILWKSPNAEDRSRLAETALDVVIAKPVAGAAIANALFGANGNPPLVSQAA